MNILRLTDAATGMYFYIASSAILALKITDNDLTEVVLRRGGFITVHEPAHNIAAALGEIVEIAL